MSASDSTALVIAGPTLVLRYAIAADAPALFELGRDPEVTRFFSWGPYERVEQAERYVEDLEHERADGTRLEFLIADRDAGPIGVIGLSEFVPRDRRCVIGTWLGRDWWGSGANRESKALICRLAFDRLGIERLTAYASPRNERSQAALEHLGFAREGLLRSWHRHGDQVHDVLIYSLLGDDWERSALARTPVELRGEPPPLFVVSR